MKMQIHRALKHLRKLQIWKAQKREFLQIPEKRNLEINSKEKHQNAALSELKFIFCSVFVIYKKYQISMRRFGCFSIDQNWRNDLVNRFRRQSRFSFVSFCNLFMQDFHGRCGNLVNLLSDSTDRDDCFS